MKMPNRDTTRQAFLLGGMLLLLALAGCKTTRQAASTATGAAKEAGEFFLSVGKQAFQYQTLEARMRVDINLPDKELSSRVDIKMVKDSAFQLSVLPFLGVEMFRIEFSTDSVKLIDRMNKCYAIDSYDALKGRFPVDFNFYNLQALFTNRIFVPGEREITPRQYGRFSLKQEGAATEAQIKDAMKLLYAFRADSDEKLLSTRVTDPSERYTLQWLYTDFRQTDAQTFPMQMEARATDEGKTAGEIKLFFSRMQRNAPIALSFPIPEKYKRITLAEILKKM
jgi:hypothetical protein